MALAVGRSYHSARSHPSHPVDEETGHASHVSSFKKNCWFTFGRTFCILITQKNGPLYNGDDPIAVAQRWDLPGVPGYWPRCDQRIHTWLQAGAHASRTPTRLQKTLHSLVFFRANWSTEKYGALRGEGREEGSFVDQNPDPIGSETFNRIRKKMPKSQQPVFNPAPSDTVESKGRQMNPCWINYFKKSKNPPEL
jgi:hypothetical protein